MVSFEEIEEVYKRLEGRLKPDEFKSMVEEKVIMMNGLCDSKTAAMLVASELGLNETIKIKDIAPDKGGVVFIAKVISIGDIHEFSRSDSSTGRVVNITFADDTGSIKAALWDEASDLVKIGDIKMGQSLKVKGYIKEGQRGLEVNVGRGGNIEHVDKAVAVNLEPMKINDIKSGMSGLNIIGRIIDTGKVRAFQRKDGTTGKVTNLTLGDETGKIRVTLWDSKAESADFKIGDTVEIINGYARENTFSNQIELQLGSGGNIMKSNTAVDYSETFTQIADIGINSAYSVTGHVSGLDEIREFDRPDGTKNKVSNIYVSDDTGRIRVALWGEHAELVNELDIGSEISIIDAFAKPGRNEEIELSAGARTRIQVLRK
ncbi:single-stranded DNA-binding protein [Candidatus Methanoperedens nitroreducens]|uniref:Single-stranded DNA-binding protein n=1 Tax=Candidatus Methanoperedens nitratireducens TaxID=1392998 RepID=A0A062V6D0_9EURY|nr:OB-fold nucleic acid binding domain-containing protein [Candidatus Methanoperedens nitroreducens]KCZ72148.1 single-stranded DNA-binding protein [Candidatus Methanoperedens nitroreducens]MDJ1421875.1 OB-fold nucleic acid binding domain-containing protein [Candidatus Methanoperedens sp.]